MQSIQDIASIGHEQLSLLDEKRKKLLRHVRIGLAVLFVVAACVSALFIRFLVYLVNIEPWDTDRDLGGFSGLVFTVGAFIILGSIYIGKAIVSGMLHGSDYYAEYKRDISARLIARAGKGLVYRPDSGITREEFMASGLFNDEPTRYDTQEGISGRVDQVDFHFAEVNAIHDGRSDGKGDKTFPIFNGLFFIADFHKPFQNRTIVVPDFLKRLEKRPGLERIKLEDPDFERYFEVYGENQVESRYVLSPSFMSRIVQFRVRAGVFIYVSFVEGKLCIAIPQTKRLSDPPVFQSLFKSNRLARYAGQLQFLVGVVSDFKLNTTLWKN